VIVRVKRMFALIQPGEQQSLATATEVPKTKEHRKWEEEEQQGMKVGQTILQTNSLNTALAGSKNLKHFVKRVIARTRRKRDDDKWIDDENKSDDVSRSYQSKAEQRLITCRECMKQTN
jgi:hypothetical protein